nr:hypothetical protein [uncultured Dyadobacter sp.]
MFRITSLFSLFIQSLWALPGSMGATVDAGTESRPTLHAFSTCSDTNKIVSFEGSFFRKQRGHYRSDHSSDYQLFSDWITGKLYTGKKHGGDFLTVKHFGSRLNLQVAVSASAPAVRKTYFHVRFAGFYTYLHRFEKLLSTHSALISDKPVRTRAFLRVSGFSVLPFL